MTASMHRSVRATVLSSLLVIAPGLALLSTACSPTVATPVPPSRQGGSGGGGSGGSGGSNPGTGGMPTNNGGNTGGTGGLSGGATGGSGGPAANGGGGGTNPGSGGAGNADAGDARTGTPAEASSYDPGPEGDGIRQIGPTFKAAPETMVKAGVPQGKVFTFTLPGGSKIYPRAPSRMVSVYVPSQYTMGTPAPFMVAQDRQFFGFTELFSRTLDNLIADKKVPTMVVVIVDNGGGDAVGSERGLEYDTVSGLYAEWVDTELLPAVEAATKTQLPTQAVTFTRDPEGRGAVGGSSSGAAAFSMAWWRPDLFRKVLSFSGTFVNQVPANSPFPHGCWVYHDVDPYDAAKPSGLIVQHCEPTGGGKYSSTVGPCDTPLSKTACEAVAGCSWNTQVNKPIRVWLSSGTNDLGAGGGPGTYRNFDLANQRMAAALALRGYHFHYDHAMGGGHVDANVTRQTLPEALIWLWRGYKSAP